MLHGAVGLSTVLWGCCRNFVPQFRLCCSVSCVFWQRGGSKSCSEGPAWHTLVSWGIPGFRKHFLLVSELMKVLSNEETPALPPPVVPLQGEALCKSTPRDFTVGLERPGTNPAWKQSQQTAELCLGGLWFAHLIDNCIDQKKFGPKD